MNENLTASLEDYLEVIFQRLELNSIVRSKEISKDLGVSNASVTGALQALSKKELINYIPYEPITLTKEGKKLAKIIVQKHKILYKFFLKVLKVSEEESNEIACKLEHLIPKHVIFKIAKFTENFK